MADYPQYVRLKASFGERQTNDDWTFTIGTQTHTIPAWLLDYTGTTTDDEPVCAASPDTPKSKIARWKKAFWDAFWSIFS